MVAVLASLSLAFAQGGIDIAEFFLIGHNPLLMIGFVVAGVKIIRDLEFFSWIDGKIPTAIAAVVVGAVTGLAVEIFDSITVMPFADYPVFIGAVAYGALAGLSGFFGVNLYDLIVGRFFDMRAKSPAPVAAPAPDLPPSKKT